MQLQIQILVLLCLLSIVLGQESLNLLDFPFDQNSGDNYASLNIEGQIPESFTVCSALLFSVVPSKVGFGVQVLQFFEKEKDTKVGLQLVVMDGMLAFKTFDVHAVVLGMGYMNQEQIDLSRWIHICYSDDKSNDILVVNGRVLLNDTNTMKSISDHVWEEGLTINMGKHLTGKMTNMNIFSPALTPERMQNITNALHIECKASSGNFLAWGKGNMTFHGIVNVQVVDSSLGPCQTRSNALLANKETYELGKYNWTSTNDTKRCQEQENQGAECQTELKLTGCNQGFHYNHFGHQIQTDDGQFTCNNGQCVNMSERCDQVRDCRDGTDEDECQLIVMMKGYNKKIPPLSKKNSEIVPVQVNVTIRLLKVMDINEVDATIDLQFEIILEWVDDRLTYNNLKTKSSLNALTDEDIRNVWLPLVIYENTDKKETTRLGVEWEWTTSVTITREGNFTRLVLQIFPCQPLDSDLLYSNPK